MLEVLLLIVSIAGASPAWEPSDESSFDRVAFLRGHIPEEANFFEIALVAAQRSIKGRGLLSPDDPLSQMGALGRKKMASVCGRGKKGGILRARTVTHYYVPLLKAYSEKPCKKIEGVCRFWKNGEEYIANYGKPDVKFKNAFCKNGIGYGLNANCTHPCRSLAASTKHHRGGEVIFFPELVGKKCGTGANKMIHDGFMIVNDTGDASRFNRTGRFDFFWGECRNFKDGVCRDKGALEISRILSGSRFCRAWTPQDPSYNSEVKVAFYNAVRAEALARGDYQAAGAFDLDAWTAPSHQAAGRKLAAKAAATKTRAVASAR